ncbi:MAG: Hsp20/alpha crystallin family protein [Bacteroidetes bacterium]|nr:Hsp20/alpha crystallin family protein [Bacteroidota bacterium]
MATDASQSSYGRRRYRRWPRYIDVEELGRSPGEPAGAEPFRWRGRGIPGGETTWAPVIDVYDKGDRFVVRAELPGMTENDFDISVAENILTIKGDRRPPADVKDEEYELCETCYGPFVRYISLPADVDAGKAEAVYGNGILEVQVPKAPEAAPTRVRIKAK